MSYSCVMNEGDVQTLRIPSEFRLNSVHVVIESSGDGILVRPVRSKMSVSDLSYIRQLNLPDRRFVQ